MGCPMNQADAVWRDRLDEWAFPKGTKGDVDRGKRRNAVARVLAANKFKNLSHLCDGWPPKEWIHEDKLTLEELVFLGDVVDKVSVYRV